MTKTEKVLRDLNLWEKAKQYCIDENNKTYFEHIKDKFELGGMFIFKDSPEGHDFWWDIKITHKI